MNSRTRYSAWNLLASALQGQADWAPAWRDAEPKARYDVIIIGGGGHGLATAYYLAKNHGITNVAVLEAGWIGGGNTGRNTTIVRSNYLYPESARLYDFSVQQYEQLAQELNFNIMFSQRGVMTLAHSRHDLDSQSRWANAIQEADPTEQRFWGHAPRPGERPSKPTGSKSVSATPSEEVSQRTDWCIANATISSRSVDCSKG